MATELTHECTSSSRQEFLATDEKPYHFLESGLQIFIWWASAISNGNGTLTQCSGISGKPATPLPAPVRSQSIVQSAGRCGTQRYCPTSGSPPAESDL